MAGFNLSTKIQLLIMHGPRHKRLKSRQIEKDFMRGPWKSLLVIFRSLVMRNSVFSVSS